MRSYLVRPRLFPLIVVAALVLCGWALAAASNPTPAEGLTNCSVSDLSISSDENAFLALINEYRADNDALPLAYSSNLNRMATWLATDMVANNYFSHTDSLGRTFGTRL